MPHQIAIDVIRLAIPVKFCFKAIEQQPLKCRATNGYVLLRLFREVFPLARLGDVALPALLIFDEPTVGIDPQSRNFILDKIKESNRNGATVIYTSHYMEEVEAICTKIAIMDNGKIIACGTSEELKKLVVDDTESISLEEVFLTLTGKKLRDY